MKSGRFLIIAVLIGSLVLAGASRQWAISDREKAAMDPTMPAAARAQSAQSGASLTSMNSYALALLLGGLRGPLVMFLWPSSEMQKTEHNLEDFDTKVEWIRLLQPEFDSVHIYQIWNKAYNISVQMASLPNKYVTILDALDYANSVDRQKPDDINILTAIASLFYDKLGNSQEKAYYTRRVRSETQALKDLVRVTLPADKLGAVMEAAHKSGMDEPAGEAQIDDFTHTATLVVEKSVADAIQPDFSMPGFVFQPLPRPQFLDEGAVKRRRLAPVLDRQGNILPQLRQPTYNRPADLPADEPFYDGSTFQFLESYAPFPYGLAPQAMGYNYFKRAQLLQRLFHEQHIQIADMVVDSRPAMTLKAWGAEEAEQGRRAELRLFGLDAEGEATALERRAPGADGTIDDQGAYVEDDIVANDYQPRPDPAAGPLAMYSYATAAKAYRDARTEFLQHIQQFPNTSGNFYRHIDDAVAFTHLYRADHDFLDGVLNPAGRKQAWMSAVSEYTLADQSLALIVLRYYMSDAVARSTFPVNPQTHLRYTRANIDTMPPSQRDQVVKDAMYEIQRLNQGQPDEYGQDREEVLNYLRRAMARRALLTGPTTRPTSRPSGDSTQPYAPIRPFGPPAPTTRLSAPTTRAAGR